MHAADRTNNCFNEGQIVTYECQVPAVGGTLDWKGIGFDCPSHNTIANNVLPLPTTSCPLDEPVYTGICGPYFGNLTCTDDQQSLLSVLEFNSSFGMNGSTINCLLNNIGIETFSVRIGGKFTVLIGL